MLISQNSAVSTVFRLAFAVSAARLAMAVGFPQLGSSLALQGLVILRFTSSASLTAVNSAVETRRVDCVFMPVKKWISRGFSALLISFHVWLLATQWQAGRLSDPGLLIRWAAALALVLSLRALYKSGASAFSRKSIVIWLLAALLHGPTVASRAGVIVNFNALPEAAITAVLQTAAVAGALTLTILIFAAVLRRRTLALSSAWSFIATLGGLFTLSDGFFAVVSARPPPAQL